MSTDPYQRLLEKIQDPTKRIRREVTPERVLEFFHREQALRAKREAYEDRAVARALEGWSPDAVLGVGGLAGVVSVYESSVSPDRPRLPESVSFAAFEEAKRLLVEERGRTGKVVDVEAPSEKVRVRIKGLKGVIESLWKNQIGRCFYCLCDLLVSGFHVDHKLPVSRGGGSHEANLCCACPKCNLRKHAMTEAEFRASGKIVLAKT